MGRRASAAILGFCLAVAPAAAMAGNWQGCFDQRQNSIAAKYQSRVNGAVGICQQGRVSTDMWQEVETAARRCGAPSAVVTQIHQNVIQSRNVAAASCVQ